MDDNTFDLYSSTQEWDEKIIEDSSVDDFVSYGEGNVEQTSVSDQPLKYGTGKPHRVTIQGDIKER